jgi:nitronate monooxygenase
MDKWKVEPLIIGDLEIKTPIVQGGMGVGISLSGLASAVANEGGVGVISAALIGMNEVDIRTNFREANIRALRREIRQTRKLTDGVIGVNIMRVLTNYDDMVRVSIEEKVDIIFVGAGLPLDLPKFINKDSHTKLVPIVSSSKGAKTITKWWDKEYGYLPDAIVLEGPKAGGHLGFANVEAINSEKNKLENIVAQTLITMKELETKTIKQKEIPIIAGGGIYTGEDINQFLKLGIAGVQLGTRFVTTTECDAHENFKMAYINAKEEDIIIINSPVGMPGRAIRNEFIENLKDEREKLNRLRCIYNKCIMSCEPVTSPYCIASALDHARKGELEKGFAFVGANGHLSTEIVTVNELMNNLWNEYTNSTEKKMKTERVKELNRISK